MELIPVYHNNLIDDYTSTQIKCPFCLTDKIRTITQEQTKISCSICYKTFLFIRCISCNGKIYFKSTKDCRYFLNIKIKCPYTHCKIFFLNQTCFYCRKINKRPCNSKDPDTYVECNNNYCKKNYSIFDCPFNFEDFTIVANEKISEGKKIICQNDRNKCNKTFYQLSCIECREKLIWKSEKKLYIEGQPVLCQNKFCKSYIEKDSFNKVTCPYCNKLLIFKKNIFNFGVLIECINCLGKFSICFCPECKGIMQSEENLESKKINCNRCCISFTIVNCLKCRKINIWNSNSFIQGQSILCSYCDFKFNKIMCDSCKRLIPFYKADFKFGRDYKCIYDDCKVDYRLLLCPCCKVSNYVLSDEKHSRLLIQNKNQPQIKCGNCGISFLNSDCMKCNKVILSLGDLLDSFVSNLNENYFEYFVVCPYDDCRFYQLVLFKKCIKCFDIFCNFYIYEEKNCDSAKNLIYRNELCKKCHDATISGNFSECDFLSIFGKIKSLLNKELNQLNREDSSLIKEKFISHSKNYFGMNFIQGMKYKFYNPEINEVDEFKESMMIRNKKIYENEELKIFQQHYINQLPTYDELKEHYSSKYESSHLISHSSQN